MSVDGKLRSIFREHLPHWHWQSIESGGTGGGIPDANYCVNKMEGWVEFKRADGWQVKRTKSWPAQVAWMARRSRAGGRCYIAIRRAGDELWILSPVAGRELLMGKTLRTLSPALILYEGFHGPARWDWNQVARVLTS